MSDLITMPNFTGGTWSMTQGQLIRVNATLPGDERPLTVCGVHRMGKFGRFLPDGAGDPIANAHLIAAAPELYRALHRLDENGFTQATWTLVKRALAKAEGRQQI